MIARCAACRFSVLLRVPNGRVAVRLFAGRASPSLSRGAAMNTIEFDQRTTAKAILISVVAALGGFLFGFDTAVINGAVAAIRSDFALSSGLTGFAVSCALLGSALG